MWYKFFVSPIVLNVYVKDIQMWCILPLNICSCIVFHTTPNNSRAVLSSNRRWKCVQKLTDKNREFKNLRMTTILYYTTANTTVCIVFTLFISFTSDAVKIVYTFRDYVYHSICIGYVYKKLCAWKKLCVTGYVFFQNLHIYTYKIGGDRLRIFDRCVWSTFTKF